MPHGYAYETLTAEQKTVYDEVYRIILAHDSKVKVSTCDEKVLEKSYRSVIADHGGIFWVSGYNYTQYTMEKRLSASIFPQVIRWSAQSVIPIRGGSTQWWIPY